jgi:hypothetical protein
MVIFLYKTDTHALVGVQIGKTTGKTVWEPLLNLNIELLNQ